jgi:hypothetical protein
MTVQLLPTGLNFLIYEENLFSFLSAWSTLRDLLAFSLVCWLIQAVSQLARDERWILISNFLAFSLVCLTYPGGQPASEG